MTYAALALCFVAVAAIAGLALPLLTRKVARPGRHLGAVGITVVVLIALTAVFDNVMIAAGLFHYAPAQLLGLHIGLAPVEDFAYPLAGALLLPGLWVLLRRRPAARSGEHGEEPT